MAETPSPPAIEVSGLVKSYAGVLAVNNISFTVPRGEIIGFLGPNGAGKSTTMRILTGYLPATSGKVSICGFPVASDPDAVKRRVGYMPENNPLPEEMRVSEYLYFRGRLKEVARRKLGSRIDEVLELCDLKRVRHKIIGKLSKGFRQRVGIAESVLAEPPVIIMDEPTIGLDPHQILIVRDLIASLRGRMTVLISSHILPEIEMTCDRVLIINQGRIVAQGTPAELRREVLGQSVYEIEAAGPLGSLMFLLGTIDPGLSIASEGAPDAAGFRTIKLKALSDEDAGEAILRTCMSEGLRVRAISRAHPTLEDVFLAATRRSWDAVAGEPKAGGAG
jgi:ABC-2 type transport system ATP-binding protein